METQSSIYSSDLFKRSRKVSPSRKKSTSRSRNQARSSRSTRTRHRSYSRSRSRSYSSSRYSDDDYDDSSSLSGSESDESRSIRSRRKLRSRSQSVSPPRRRDARRSKRSHSPYAKVNYRTRKESISPSRRREHARSRRSNSPIKYRKRHTSRDRSRSRDSHQKRPRNHSPFVDKKAKINADSNATSSKPHKTKSRKSDGETSPQRDISSNDKAVLNLAAENEALAKTTRAGGTYIPPGRLKQLQKNITDKSGEAYQRLSWEGLKKGINGCINKANHGNIKNIVVDIFGQNLVRGRGLFAKSIMRSQQAATIFTPVYACLVAVINTKLPAVGALVVSRLISSFLKAVKRNDKAQTLANAKFLAHLVNYQVCHELVALQIIALLLENPTEDSVEVSVGFMREVGAYLTESSPKATHASFERFRTILHEAEIEKRAQYMIEVLFKIRKDGFKDNPIKNEDLDLVEDDDQITHYIGLEDELETESGLDFFQLDPNFLENEAKYSKIKAEILGEESDDEESNDADSEDIETESEEEEAEENDAENAQNGKPGKLVIHDLTETELINLRRTIYLTLMSSLDFEEACHKLLKMSKKPGYESHLSSMVVECGSQERSYEKYYGLIGERLCKVDRTWEDRFSEEFVKLYQTIHRYETNRIRNMAKFFAHLFFTDSISWKLMENIKLTEEDTTSSSRIFVKIMLQEICEAIGLDTLKERFSDKYMIEYYRGLFPMENAKHLRFAINYFTSIGFGPLTDEMREQLRNLPKIAAARRRADSESSGSYSDSDSYTSDSSGYSSRSYTSRSSYDSRSD